MIALANRIFLALEVMLVLSADYFLFFSCQFRSILLEEIQQHRKAVFLNLDEPTDVDSVLFSLSSARPKDLQVLISFLWVMPFSK
jgi:hypothetical protein